MQTDVRSSPSREVVQVYEAARSVRSWAKHCSAVFVCVFLNVWEIILFLAYLHQNVFDIFLNIVFYLQRSIFVVNVLNKFYKKMNIQFLGISSS